VPDVEYTPHENTFRSPKAKPQGVKLKSDKGRRSRKARRALKSLSLWTFFAISWHLIFRQFEPENILIW